MSRKTIYRSAITGEIVTKKHALENPDTTVKEILGNLRQELTRFYDWVQTDTANLNYDTGYLVDEYIKQK